MTTTDDKKIVERALSGDKEAFGELVSRYKDAVYGVAYHFLGNSHDAQDLAQEVFLQIYRRLPQLRDTTKFRAWIYRITANLYKNWFRRQSSLPEHVQLSYHAQMFEGRRPPSPEQVVEKKERKSILSQALGTLSDCNRLTLTLFYINGYTYQEVGDFLTIPVGTVKSRLNEARKKLEKEAMKMVKEGLEKEKPGEAFVKRFEELTKFPRHEPEVEIEKVPDTGMRIICREFLDWVCKIDGGKTHQAFYDWPERLITSIMVSEITGKRIQHHASSLDS